MILARESLARLRKIIENTTGRLRPRPPMRLSEHAEKFRVVPSGTSNYAGPWRNEMTPHLVEVMDAISEDSIHTVILLGPAQLAKTELGINFACYHIHWKPGPGMIVMPDDTLAETFSNMRFGPTLQQSPEFAKLLDLSQKRSSTNKIQEKKFPMASVFIGSAETPKTFVQRPCQWVWMDDVDQTAQSIKNQGSPDMLLDKRTETYSGSEKKLYTGNPTDEASHVWRLYRKGDRRRSRLPCPFCGHMQSLQYERFIYETSEDKLSVLPGSVKYPCAGCKKEIPESYAMQMRAGIKFEAAKKTRGVASFWVEGGAFDAGWKSWWKILDEGLKAKDKPEEWRAYVNITLARPMLDSEDPPPWEELQKRKSYFERGQIPKDALCMSLAVDVQHDWLEALLVGWGRGKRSFVIQHYRFDGQPSNPETWEPLRRVMTQPYEAPLLITTVDCADGNTAPFVFDFVRSMATGDERVVAVRGANRWVNAYVLPPEQLDLRLSGQRKTTGMRAWTVGVDYIKYEIYAAMRMSEPQKGAGYLPGWIHFAKGFGDEFYQQATSEKLQVGRGGKARKTRMWVKTRERNEVLDLLVMARGGIAIKGWHTWTDHDWDRIEEVRKTFAKKPVSLATEVQRPQRTAADNYGGETLD